MFQSGDEQVRFEGKFLKPCHNNSVKRRGSLLYFEIFSPTAGHKETSRKSNLSGQFA